MTRHFRGVVRQTNYVYDVEVTAPHLHAAYDIIQRREGVPRKKIQYVEEIRQPVAESTDWSKFNNNDSSSSSESSSSSSSYSSSSLGESLGSIGLLAGIFGIIAFWEVIVTILIICAIGGGGILGLGMIMKIKEEGDKAKNHREAKKNRPAQVSHKYRVEAFK